jgi:hypothetical protein
VQVAGDYVDQGFDQGDRAADGQAAGQGIAHTHRDAQVDADLSCRFRRLGHVVLLLR